MEKPKLTKELGMIYLRETSKQKRRYGIYECDCGKEFMCQSFYIDNGKTKSCGCLQKKIVGSRNRTHGLGGHKLYKVWSNMNNRCYNINFKQHRDYGGRGIIICDEWKYNFVSFYNWSIEKGYSEGLTIDRINNDDGYSPENCRWADKTEQQCNSRAIRSTNTSGYKGVTLQKSRNKWASQIGYKNKVIPLGRYNTKTDAVIARNNYIIQHNLPHKIQEIL